MNDEDRRESPTAMEGAERGVRSVAFAPLSAAVTPPTTTDAGAGNRISPRQQAPAPASPSRFFLGRLVAALRRTSGYAPRDDGQPAEHELANGRCMGMHASELVCLEAYREKRRGPGLLSVVRGYEERVVEGSAIAMDRVEADVPEFQSLRACHAAARDILLDIGAGHGLLIVAGVQVPTELYSAQDQMASLVLSLGQLLKADIEENRDHRGIVRVLRGDGEEAGDGE